MNLRKTVAAFAFSLLISGFLTWTISRLTRNQASLQPRAVGRIVIAAKDISSGQVLNADSLSSIDWAAPEAFPGSLSNPALAIGRVALESLVRGEPVLVSKLAPLGSGTGAAAVIPVGMRAITLQATEVSTTSHFLEPGDLVDVLTTYPPQVGGLSPSPTVLEAVRVFAVGEKLTPNHDEQPATANSITLLITPSEIPALNQAMALGKINIIMRNRVDTLRNAYPALQQATLSKQGATPGTGPAAPGKTTGQRRPAANFTVETIAGGKLTSQSFEGVL